MKHPTTLEGMTMDVLAEEVENLRYDAVYEFLYHLRTRLEERATKDSIAGRTELARALRMAAEEVDKAGVRMEKVWSICEPYMQDE